jgi:uncharacterized protein YbjT (DUF2867 family)
MSSTILITGATGTIGRLLVGQLEEAGVPFRVFVRRQEDAEHFRLRGVRAFVGDFAEPSTLRPALEGVDKLFLLSAATPRSPELQGNAVEEARRAGVSHLVKLSASCAGADCPAPIKRWHHATEAHIVRSGLTYTFLRPNGFMQNTLKWARTIRTKGEFYMPVGGARSSQIDARDIAAVAAAVLTSDPREHDGRVYEITGPQPISYYEVADILSRVCGKEVRYVEASYEFTRRSMIDSGMEDWLADAVIGTYRFISDGHQAHLTDVVETVAGRKPRTFERFATDYAASLS